MKSAAALSSLDRHRSLSSRLELGEGAKKVCFSPSDGQSCLAHSGAMPSSTGSQDCVGMKPVG